MTTIITTCKGRLKHLKSSLPTWLTYTPYDVLIVDYGCPDGITDFLHALDEPRVSSIFLPGRNDFNKPVALNTAAYFLAHTRDEKRFLFFDADTVIESELPHAVREPATMWIAHPSPEADKRSLTGVLAVDRLDFERTGGYDTKMLGYGAEDLDLRVRLHRLLPQPELRFFPSSSLRSIEHSDFERTRYYSDKNLGASSHRNLLRLVGKLSALDIAYLKSQPELADILLASACQLP